MKKGLRITALVVILVVAVGLVLIVANRDRLVNIAVTRTVDTIESAAMKSPELPVPEAKAREIFERARERIRAGELDREKVRELIEKFREFYEDRELDSGEIEKLLRRLEGAGE